MNENEIKEHKKNFTELREKGKNENYFILFLKLLIIILIFYFRNKNISIFHTKRTNYTKNATNINTYVITDNTTIFDPFLNISLLLESLQFKTYAQIYEDLILLAFLFDVKKGFYIDVGAYNPHSDSVTKYYYDRGWNGINIEPLDKEYNLLVIERPRDINLKILAGDKKMKNKTFYMSGQLSTVVDKFKQSNTQQKVMEADTLSNICKQYVPKGTIIQFCKIDVEGAEKEVLLGYDFKNCRPKIFCIESTRPMTMIPTHKEFDDILINNNYSFAYQYYSNRYYIDNRIPLLKKRIHLINDFLEHYRK